MPMYEMQEMLKSKLLVNSNVWHNTYPEGAHEVPLGPPIRIVEKMKLGEVFRPCLKSSLVYHFLAIINLG